MSFPKNIIVGILTMESRLVISKYKPFIVAVTGSVGKTSTKDAIYDVLSSAECSSASHPLGFVRKSEKSHNSEIGLPLTILGASNAWYDLIGWSKNILIGLGLILFKKEYPDCLIMELGADHPGDIKRVVKWLHPDIAVITKISNTPVHVEFFKSPEEVFEEKAALALAVKPGGAVIIFADDEKNASLTERFKEKAAPVVSFGFSDKAAVRCSNMKIEYGSSGEPAGTSFNLSMDGTTANVTIHGTLGPSCAYPVLSAAAVGKVCGIPAASIARSLGDYKAPKGRLNIIPGLNGSTLLDDSYNSSPDAASAALEALKGITCSGAKVAILGDMMELGKYAAEEHRRIGREAAAVVSKLIMVGPRSKLTAEGAIQGGLAPESVKSFDSSAEAAVYAATIVQIGDVVLIKGSQSVRMERVTKALLREPERATELLVRQEKEWLEKA